MPSLHLDPYYEVSGPYAVNPFDAEQILCDSLAILDQLGINIQTGRMRPWMFAHENRILQRDDFTMQTATNSLLFTKRSAGHKKVYERYGIELDGTDGICQRFATNNGAIITKSMVQVSNLAGGHAYDSLKQRTVHEIGHGVLTLGHCTEIDCIMQENPSVEMVGQGRIPGGFCRSHQSALAKFVSI